MAAPSTASLRGRVLAEKFQLQERVGAGAMGEVWSARHLGLDKQVAVKIVIVDETTDPLIVGRFKSEARAASRLDHPNSVQILDFGEEQDGLLYIVMEFLRGQDLGTLLKRTGRLSEQRATAIMNQILGALITAHQNNIVHRDLKPANIMLVKNPDGAEVVKVCDFGIAKLQDPLNSEDPTGMMTLTRAGAVVGTPSYMSPEQAGGKRVDARSDLFSCGVILYHMLAGEKPFRAGSLMGLLTQVMTEDPRPLQQVVSTVDMRLVEVVNRAIAKRPNERFQSAREMRQTLADVVERPEDRTMAMGGPMGAPMGAVPQAAPGQPMVMPPPGTPPDRTRALPASSLPQGANATRPLLDLQRGASRAGPPPANMQSMGGQSLAAANMTWSRTGQFEPEAKSPSSSGGLSWPVLLVVLLALGCGGYWYFVMRDAADVGKLQSLVDDESWGTAENYALKHFEVFRDDPSVASMTQAMLEYRRTALKLPSETGIAFDPSYRLAPSVWQGVLTMPATKDRLNFQFRIEEVTENTFAGVFDWPDDGARALVVGYIHGNQMLMWDYELLTEQTMGREPYKLFDKKSVMIGDGKMKGFDGPYQALFTAELTR